MPYSFLISADGLAQMTRKYRWRRYIYIHTKYYSIYVYDTEYSSIFVFSWECILLIVIPYSDKNILQIPGKSHFPNTTINIVWPFTYNSVGNVRRAHTAVFCVCKSTFCEGSACSEPRTTQQRSWHRVGAAAAMAFPKPSTPHNSEASTLQSWRPRIPPAYRVLNWDHRNVRRIQKVGLRLHGAAATWRVP